MRRVAPFCCLLLVLSFAPVSWAAPARPESKSGAKEAAVTAEDQGNPQSLELNEQGVAAMKAGNIVQAEELFRKAMSIDSKNVTAVFNLAGALMANKKEAAAVELLESYLKDYQDDAGLYVRLGDAYFSSRKPKEALSAYEKAYKVLPGYPGLSVKLGTVYGLLNRLDDAERMYLIAVQQDPKNAQAMSNLASIFLGNGKPDQAISAAKRALALKASSEAYVTLGTAYEIQKDYKNALIAFQRGADLGDKRAELERKINGLKEVVKE